MITLLFSELNWIMRWLKIPNPGIFTSQMSRKQSKESFNRKHKVTGLPSVSVLQEPLLVQRSGL